MRKGAFAVFVVLLVGHAVAQPPSSARDIAAEIDVLLATADLAESRQVIFETAGEWAARDPVSAFTALAALPPGPLRDAVESSLVFNWLATDTVAALRFFASLEQPPDYLLSLSGVNTSTGSLPMSSDTDFVEVFEIAGELPDEIGRLVRTRALRSIAMNDAPRAADLVLRVPRDERRQAALNVTREYTALDAEAALAWARALGEPDVERSVVETMAAQDPYGMLARAASGDDSISLALVATGAASAQALDKARFGTALAQLPRSEERAQALARFTQSWLVSEQEGALEWLATVGVDMPREAILRAAQRAGSDPELAAAYARRLQGANRAEWIAAVASAYGRQDPGRALAWIEQFSTEPVYPEIAARLVPQLALSDGPRAARLVEGLAGREGQGASWTVARQWAKSDPVAAALWADGLPETTRTPSVRAAVDEWHSYDPAAAERSAVALPASPLREDALVALVSAVAADDEVPPERLLSAFSTDAARQTAVLAAVGYLIRNQKPVARELAERRLTDPYLRCRANELLDPPAGRQGGLFRPMPTACQTD